MKQHALLLLLTGFLSGCIGTKITGRQTDTSTPHPDLHSVPEKPAPLDVTKVEAERSSFEKGHEQMLRENQSLRANNKAPNKPEDDEKKKTTDK